MNAVTATTSLDPGIILAASNTVVAPALAQAEIPSGFVDLINALLTPLEAAPPEQTHAAASDPQANLENTASDSVTTRSSPEIADALIRSMLGSSLSASNLYSDKRPAGAQTGNSKLRQPAENSQPAGAPALMTLPAPMPISLPMPQVLTPITQAAIPSAELTPAVAANTDVVAPPPMMFPGIAPALPVPPPAPGGTTKFRGKTTAPGADPKPGIPQAGLAFALRLTPLESPEGNTPETPPKAAPIAMAPAPSPKAAPHATPAPVASPAAPATIAPATVAVPVAAAALPTPAPAQEVARVIAVAVEQNQVAPVVENSPAPTESQAPAKDNKDNSGSDTPSKAPTEIKPRQESDQRAEAAPVIKAVAATADHNSDFGRPLPNPLPTAAPQRVSDAAPQQQLRTVEQALRGAEPAAPMVAAPRIQAIQDIAVRIAGPNASAVDLRLTERAGQVHVSVRTADTGLQTSLRQDLGTLVNSLERSGYRTEAFTSREGGSLAAVSAQMDARGSNTGQDAGQNGRGETSQDRAPRDRASQDRSGQNGSQDSNGGQQQRRQQQQNWMDTLEKTQ